MDQEKGVSVDQTNENPSVVIEINLQESCGSKTISSSDEHQVDNSFGTKGLNLDVVIEINLQGSCGSKTISNSNEHQVDNSFGTKGLNLDNDCSQHMCRVCQLSALESGKSLVDLITLGCGCKGDLAFAHSHCAEAWFKLKGNRICEICGESANNITGAVDMRLMEEWNENRSSVSNVDDSSERSRGWKGQPLCNFLMACLVIAFVLPWFFRVNIF